MGYMSAGDMYQLIFTPIEMMRERKAAEGNAYQQGVANKVNTLMQDKNYDINPNVGFFDKLLNNVGIKTGDIKATELNDQIRSMERLIYGQQYDSDISPIIGATTNSDSRDDSARIIEQYLKDIEKRKNKSYYKDPYYSEK